jgi:hypothetical protein
LNAIHWRALHDNDDEDGRGSPTPPPLKSLRKNRVQETLWERLKQMMWLLCELDKKRLNVVFDHIMA